jgi:tryptophan-rich sensory protein
MRRSALVPVLAALACLAALLVGGLLTRPNLDWYATLERPSFAPPNSVFPIVWPILYALMAISAWLAWRAPGSGAEHRQAMTWFFIQLAIGVLWSVAFFVMHSPLLGVGVILAFLAAIVMTMWRFHSLRPVASLLLLPLAVWVSYASVLNIAIWDLNP